MNDIANPRLWILVFWTFGTLKTEVAEDYLYPEFGTADYFDIVNAEPLYLNESYCLNYISAEVITSNSNVNSNNKALFYLKIIWDSKHFMTSIMVESDSLNDSYCEAENKHHYNRKPLNQTFHIFPDDVNEGIRFFPIKLDCKYIIIPELDGLCRPLKLKFLTPVCIGNETCSCRNLSIPPPNLGVEEESKGLAVTWSFPKGFKQNVSQLNLAIYLEDGINIKKITKRKISIHTLNPEGGTQYKEHFTLNITVDSDYRIQGYFENRINCHGNSSFVLYPDPVALQELRHNKLVFISAFLFVSMFFFASLLFVCKKHFKRICHKMIRTERVELSEMEDYNHKEFLLPQMVYNTVYVDKSRDPYWFDYRDLTILKELGSGNFGVVFLAKSTKSLKGSNVFAIKQLRGKVSADEVADFMEEMNTFRQVGNHPNVVKMLGFCESPYPLTIIMEFVPHNLHKYLKNLRCKFERRKASVNATAETETEAEAEAENPIQYAEIARSRSLSTLNYNYISQSEVECGPAVENTDNGVENSSELNYVLDNRELEIFGLQIARGMAHLESLGIVHRDLAVRNVLMDQSKNLKISDFGMSKMGVYVNKRMKKLPLRWMSPEAITNRVYTNKSDVWSFGIVLWEIGTLGAFPYPHLDNEEVIAFIEKGGHLERPENVTTHLYNVMIECWARFPEDRPSFEDLVRKIEGFCQKSNGYVDFESLKSNYVFPPMEEDVDKTRDDGPQIETDYVS